MKTASSSSIKFYMTAKCVSLRDLAEKTGLSYGYVSNLISGSKKSEKGLSAIYQALGMDQILISLVQDVALYQTAPVEQEAEQ